MSLKDNWQIFKHNCYCN